MDCFEDDINGGRMSAIVNAAAAVRGVRSAPQTIRGQLNEDE
jgi:hypothetical protein